MMSLPEVKQYICGDASQTNNQSIIIYIFLSLLAMVFVSKDVGPFVVIKLYLILTKGTANSLHMRSGVSHIHHACHEMIPCNWSQS